MDVNNRHLKKLCDNVDRAFQGLLKEPESLERNLEYEAAKRELDTFVLAMRYQLNQQRRVR